MAQVKAVPDGFRTVTVDLNLKGAAEAIEFYQQAFGAEEHRPPMPGPNNTVMHAELKIGNSIVMLADAMMGPPTQSSCHLYVEDADAWWKRATAAGAQVVLAIHDAFWGDRYGVLSDRWGNRWGIATHQEDVSPEVMQRRFEEMQKRMAEAKQTQSG
jgi:PhnB protein